MPKQTASQTIGPFFHFALTPESYGRPGIAGGVLVTGDTPGERVRIEGRVLDAAVVRGRVYLNYGADWRSDFTVTLAPKVRRAFEAEGLDPEAYEGRTLRVRGWLKSFNGPMIEVTHPEQIELLIP